MPELRKILNKWDEIQLDPVSVPEIDFDAISKEEGTEEIVAWFLRNFENPAENTPYLNAEGGYQYVWGGPYDAREIIEAVFAHRALESVIFAAIDQLEEDCDVWAPNSNRVRHENDYLDSLRVNVGLLHNNMLSSISVFENSIRQLHQPGLGHNNPPEPIDFPKLPGLDSEEGAELQSALDFIKSQPEQPFVEQDRSIEKASTTVSLLSKKVGQWVAQRANDFAQETFKEAGKEFGRWTARLAIWTLVASSLSTVAHSILSWFFAIQPSF